MAPFLAAGKSVSTTGFMRINKNSLAYRFLRDAYYTLWKQNPHIYRFLLPLKLQSVQLNENERSSITFSPQRIKHIYLAPEIPCSISGNPFDGTIAGIRDGDWDRHTLLFTDTWTHECARRLLQSPKPDAAERQRLWTESGFNKTELDHMLAETAGGPKGLTDMIAAAVTSSEENRPSADIFVRIGRQGQILCEAHAASVIALSVARLTNRSETVGVISFRHKSWQEIRKKFFVLSGSAFSEGHGTLYQQLWHPDLKDIPHLHKGDDRAAFIEAAAGEGQAGAVLDIGANLGFFCHRLEDLGYRCHAIENSAILVDYMRLLRDIEGKTFTATCTSILGRSMDSICSQEYDLVLALAIFHHFLKKEQTYKQLKRLLQNLKMKRMVLQTHNPEESQMRNSYKNFDPDAFADHIVSLTCLTRRQFMGKTSEGRHVYLLSK
jgi:hypothetical protein